VCRIVEDVVSYPVQVFFIPHDVIVKAGLPSELAMTVLPTPPRYAAFVSVEDRLERPAFQRTELIESVRW
jgi:hypothetical protein